MKFYLIVLLLAIGATTSGCQAVAFLASSQSNKHTEIWSKFSHLDGARYRSKFFDGFMPNETVVMTIGHNVFVNKKWWEETFNPNVDYWHAILLHENEHAKRQEKMGPESWLWRYLWSKKFRWEEEFQADVVRWRYLVVEKGYNIPDRMLRAEAMWNAESYNGMVTKEEAYQRIRELIDQLEQERRESNTSDTSTIETPELSVPSRERN